MKLTYRPEIDGLRAIAVCAVILYHAKISIFGYQPFKGGFIGVDIFFVISGYLITAIILKELFATDSFSFKHFYKRRIRRILPALLFVMLVSLPFAWIYLLPSNFIDFSKSILYSLGFSSNFYFHYSGQLYAAESGLLKPFLHTWSLSVEEQYYILFPIVLLITFKYFKRYLIHILILSFVISLGLAEWTSRNYPSASFYFLHTRMWELLTGSILAYFEITSGYRSKNQTLNLILPSFGMLLIGHSILFFNDEMFHPSFYTLSPIIGVCLIIWFSNINEITTKILSTKLFVGVGLISYSLYLWHYPIFAYARSTGLIQASFVNKILLALLIIVLSLFSYFLVERKIINKKYSLKLFLNILFTVIFLALLNLVIINQNGFISRVPEIFGKNITEISPALTLKDQNGELCFNNLEVCKFNINAKKTIFAIGDSHMSALSYNLKNRVVKKDYSFVTSVFGNCLYFPGFDKYFKKTNKISNKCLNSYFLNLEKKLLSKNDSVAIFTGRFPLYLEKSYFNNLEGGEERKGQSWFHEMRSVGDYKDIGESFKASVDKLNENGNKIILVYPIPEAGWNIPNEIFREFFVFKKNLIQQNFIHTSYKVYIDRTKSSFKLLDSIKGKNIYRVYPHKLFCNTIIKDRCITHNKNDIFYFDSHHVSSKGSELVNNLILKEIIKIEKK